MGPRIGKIAGHEMKQLGVGVIGAGPWGGTLARTFSRIPGVDLRWICDLDADRRSDARAAHPGAVVTAEVEEVLADPAVGAAVVAVDAARHHSVGLQVLVADRHLLVEKPMALSVADAAALYQAASDRSRVLTVGHLLLHHPAIRRSKELIATGALGTPLYFESTRTAVGALRRDRSAWWTLAPHDISLALHLFEATPVRVSAIGYRANGETDVAVFCTVLFADGRMAHLHAARLAAANERRFSIVGSERALTFDELAPEQSLRLSEPGRADGAVSREDIPRGDPLFTQCAHFVSCAANDHAAGGNGHHALTVVRILEAGARSMAAGGAPIEVT